MRLLDLLTGRDSSRYFEGDASGAAVLLTAFASPDNEKILPTYANAVSAYGSSGVVFGLILRRLMLFSEAEFKFQNLADKSLHGSPALLRLEEPWPGATTGDLLARMEQDGSLAGNAYIRDAGDQLERLRPDWVTIISELVRDQTGRQLRRVIGYYFDPPVNDDRESAYFTVDEVAHWSPIPDPMASFRGMSWLTPVLREIEADRQMTDYKRAYLTNAATPNLLIKYDKKIPPNKLADLQEQIAARHGGVGNAFRTMILDEGADTTVLGNNFDQMKFADVQAAGENRIAVASGVPAVVAGLKEGMVASTLAGYDVGMRSFADMTMRPNWRTACGALAKLVDVPADSRLWFDVAGIAALRQGEKELADTVLVQAQAASALLMAGYTPDSITKALSAGDITLLTHSGLTSVQLYPPGKGPAPVVPPKEGA